MFTPVRDQVDNMELLEYLECPLPMNLPIAHVSPREVKTTIFTKINPNISPGNDLITGKILKELPKKRLSTLQRYLMQSSARHTYLANGK